MREAGVGRNHEVQLRQDTRRIGPVPHTELVERRQVERGPVVVTAVRVAGIMKRQPGERHLEQGPDRSDRYAAPRATETYAVRMPNGRVRPQCGRALGLGRTGPHSTGTHAGQNAAVDRGAV